MICVRQGLRKYKYKYKYKDKYKDKDKYKNTRQTYDVICFWKGDDNRSLIMKSEQNMQNISPMFFLLKDQKSKISESESRPFDLVYMKVNSILWAFKGHLIVLLLYI